MERREEVREGGGSGRIKRWVKAGGKIEGRRKKEGGKRRYGARREWRKEDCMRQERKRRVV